MDNTAHIITPKKGYNCFVITLSKWKNKVIISEIAKTQRKLFSKVVYLCFICLFFTFSIVKVEGESVKIKESEDGNIIIERIGNSIYVRFYNIRSWSSGGETRRYMDVTSLMNPEEFIRIGERIASIGRTEMVQKPFLDYWRYAHNRFGRISSSRELSPYWDPYPRYDIDIDEYSFVYYPKGNNVDITNYSLNIWNFNVPNYQEGHIYVRIVYYDFTDSMTDEELLEVSRTKIEILKEL